MVNTPPNQAPQQHNVVQNQNRNARNITQFDPIPMTYTQLYPYLVQKGLITTRSLPPPLILLQLVLGPMSTVISIKELQVII